MRAFFYYIVITPNAAKKSAKKLHKNLVNPKKSSTFAPFKLKYIEWQTRKWLLQRQFFYCSGANIEGYCRIPCALAVMARDHSILV